jgi:hypothetical protein
VLAFALLWWLGHHVAAIGVLVLIFLITVISALVPAVARVLERGEEAIRRVAGRGLTAVLLSAIELLVFTPLALLLRLAGRDALAIGSPDRPDSLWRPHAVRSGRPLYRRPFAYERFPKTAADARRTRLGRIGLVLGGVASLLLLDVGVGAGLATLRSESAPPAVNLLTAPDVPSGAHEPWRAALSDEITSAAQHESYDPYLGWRIVDFHGRYVNVAGGIRNSYEPGGAGSGDAVQVYFFGGSAMFGAFQRDAHTIPSEVARLAEADGIRIHVVNAAQLAYMNWQDVLQFESLLTGGTKPDLSVFYDGANELLSQFADGPHRTFTHLEASAIEEQLAQAQQRSKPSDAHTLYNAWRDVSVLYGVGRSIGLLPRNESELKLQSPWAGDQKDHPERRGADAAYVYSRGVDAARRLADSYGLRTAFVWQPFLYSKRAVPGEAPLQGWLATDPASWRKASQASRAGLPAGVLDLSDALDGERAPVMYDLAHTNELGARVVARALYQRLRPELVQLARREGQ